MVKAFEDFDLWGETEKKPKSPRAQGSIVDSSGIGRFVQEDDLQEYKSVLQSILYRRDFDLSSVLDSIRDSFSTCHVPRMVPRQFRRPKGGGHSDRWIDPSLILGFMFDPQQCVVDKGEPETEVCKITRRWVDPTGGKSVLKVTLTPRTEPFRKIFLEIAEAFNQVALAENLIGDRQKMVEILPAVLPYRVDCDLNTFDFVHPIVFREAATAFDGHAISIRHSGTGVILDTDIFIDPKSLVDASLNQSQFLSVLRRDFAHEIAHGLGLVDNLSRWTDSLMNYYSLDDARSFDSRLKPYDIAVLRYIYQDYDDPELLWDSTQTEVRRFWSLQRASKGA